MSIASLVTAATSALTTLLYRSGQRQVPTLTITGETWAISGSAFACFYEQSSEAPQGPLDYQGVADDYDVWMLPSQTMNAGDRIVVDGLTLKVLNDQTVGAPGPLRKVTTRRVA